MRDFYSNGTVEIQQYWSKSLNFIFHFRKKNIIFFFSEIGNIVRMPYLIFFHSSDNYQKIFFHLQEKNIIII